MTDTVRPMSSPAPQSTPPGNTLLQSTLLPGLRPPGPGPAAAKGQPAASASRSGPRPRLELAVLLLATGALYLWNLGASGWANAFYSAAAQAGSQDWTAWFFGSSDAANAITVDKPPASLWVMGLSVRLFGLSSWSILVPQALMGVATVWLVYLAVRRAAAPATADAGLAHRAGLLAGAVMALTPVAVLMFRFNNPDALLVLLMTAAAYAVLRSIQDAPPALAPAGRGAPGLRFPDEAAAGPAGGPGLRRGLPASPPRPAPAGASSTCSGAGAAMAVSAGWWLAAVELIPETPARTSAARRTTPSWN